MKQVRYQKVGTIETGFLPDQELRLAWWVMCLEEVLAWHQGIVLDSYTVKRTKEGFQLRVQGRRKVAKGKTQGVVSWGNAHSPFACFELLAALVRRNEVEWRVDKYPVFDEPL